MRGSLVQNLGYVKFVKFTFKGFRGHLKGRDSCPPEHLKLSLLGMF